MTAAREKQIRIKISMGKLFWDKEDNIKICFQEKNVIVGLIVLG